jgi:voltage-gated potassium channel
VNKRIKRFDQHVIVSGYGRNGKQSTAELLSHEEKVIVIERDEQLIDQQVDGNNSNLVYLYGDATNEEMPNNAKVNPARALITTLPSDADNLFVVLTARGLNPGMTIISRASEDRSDIKLKRAGATNVIMPDKVGGIRMAKLVSHPDIIEFVESILLRTGNAVSLEEIACKDMRSCFINKTIGELNIRKISGANLIGMKTKKGDYIFNPSPDITLKSSDKLFALGTPIQIKRLIQEMTKE